MAGADMPAADLRNIIRMIGEGFRDNAPMSAAAAASVILEGVRNDTWRILVGDDARTLDEAVRADPEGVYGGEGLSLGTVPSVSGRA
jgi:hypothetical protein